MAGQRRASPRPIRSSAADLMCRASTAGSPAAWYQTAYKAHGCHIHAGSAAAQYRQCVATERFPRWLHRVVIVSEVGLGMPSTTMSASPLTAARGILSLSASTLTWSARCSRRLLRCLRYRWMGMGPPTGKNGPNCSSPSSATTPLLFHRPARDQAHKSHPPRSVGNQYRQFDVRALAQMNKNAPRYTSTASHCSAVWTANPQAYCGVRDDALGRYISRCSSSTNGWLTPLSQVCENGKAFRAPP